VGRFGYTREEWIFLRNDEVRESWNVAKYTILPTLLKLYHTASSYPEKQLYEKFLQLDVIEITALHHYTRHGDFYRVLNKQLVTGKIDPFNQAFANLLQQALNKLPPHTGTVYRGTVLNPSLYEKLYAGKHIVTHSIFTSTSRSEKVALDFVTTNDSVTADKVSALFTIQSKNGKYISPVSEFNGTFVGKIDQEEVLFGIHSSFSVDSITALEDELGMIYINMTEL
jgi:hypothetical protein